MSDLPRRHVIVTGSTGFVGSAVVTEALRRQFKVTVLVRAESNVRILPRHERLRVMAYERLDAPSLAATLRSEDQTAFIHCAWRGVTGSARGEAYQFLENVPFMLNSIGLAHAAGCAAWIGMGSQAEYGLRNARAVETDMCVPGTAYGKAKLAAGIAGLGACEAMGLAGTWVRLFSIYGPGDSPKCLIPFVISELNAGGRPQLTGCEQIWDYLYITDAANAIIDLAFAGPGGNVNLGSGRPVRLREVVEGLEKLVGSGHRSEFGARPYSPQTPMHLEADVAKLSHLCGWAPTTSLERGLARTVEAFR